MAITLMIWHVFLFPNITDIFERTHALRWNHIYGYNIHGKQTSTVLRHTHTHPADTQENAEEKRREIHWLGFGDFTLVSFVNNRIEREIERLQFFQSSRLIVDVGHIKCQICPCAHPRVCVCAHVYHSTKFAICSIGQSEHAIRFCFIAQRS